MGIISHTCCCRLYFFAHQLKKHCCCFRSILSKGGVLYVKLRAGQLSYKEDPMGWRSLLAQTVTHRNSEARAFKVSLPGMLPQQGWGKHGVSCCVTYFQHLALSAEGACVAGGKEERRPGGFYRDVMSLTLEQLHERMFVVGRQKCVAHFAYCFV